MRAGEEGAGHTCRVREARVTAPAVFAALLARFIGGGRHSRGAHSRHWQRPAAIECCRGKGCPVPAVNSPALCRGLLPGQDWEQTLAVGPAEAAALP